MGILRVVKFGVIAAFAAAALVPSTPLASAVDSASSGTSATDLAELRANLLYDQSQAIELQNANIAARHELRVKELGYEPGTTDPREIARQMMLNKYGWDSGQFTCYDNIIMRESKWDTYADNPHSSAYGIPQALPGSKMAAFGSDWRTNPATQIAWGLDYVHVRYGTPCGAWGFKRSHGWY
jgi:hypothetical protein